MSAELRYITSRTSSGALRPGEVVPGEAHLVVAASSALDRHVELVPDSLVLLLKKNLEKEKKKGEDKRKSRWENSHSSSWLVGVPIFPLSVALFGFRLPLRNFPPRYVKVANSGVSVCSLSDTADEGAETEEQQQGCRS